MDVDVNILHSFLTSPFEIKGTSIVLKKQIVFIVRYNLPFMILLHDNTNTRDQTYICCVTYSNTRVPLRLERYVEIP